MASLALVDLARRAISHPNTVAFAKRAVTLEEDDGEQIEVPGWGSALLFVTFMVSMIGISLVRYPTYPYSVP